MNPPPVPTPAAPPTAARTGLTRRGWLAVAAASAAAGAGWAWWRLRPSEVADGTLEALWALALPSPDGQTLRLAQWRGRKLALNFWATWCPPCVQELPLLNAFYQEQQAHGWHIVGLAVDQLEPVQRFLQRMPLAFPVGLAGLQGVELSRSLGNGSGGLPFTVVITADGRIAQRKLGKLSPSDLQAWKQL